VPAKSLDGIPRKVPVKRFRDIFQKVPAKRFYGIFGKCQQNDSMASFKSAGNTN
jgi:hypothetical protein